MSSAIARIVPRLVLAAVAALFLAMPAAPASADLRPACTQPLEAHCGGVREGRGRLTACLLAQAGNLPAACLEEVQAAISGFGMQTGMTRRIVSTCEPDIERVCPSGIEGSGRITACIAGKIASVSRTCASAFRSAARAYATGE